MGLTNNTNEYKRKSKDVSIEVSISSHPKDDFADSFIQSLTDSYVDGLLRLLDDETFGILIEVAPITRNN